MCPFEPSHPFVHSWFGGEAITKTKEISPAADPQMGRLTPASPWDLTMDAATEIGDTQFRHAL